MVDTPSRGNWSCEASARTPVAPLSVSTSAGLTGFDRPAFDDAMCIVTPIREPLNWSSRGPNEDVCVCGRGDHAFPTVFSPRVPKTKRGKPLGMIRSSSLIFSAGTRPRFARKSRIWGGTRSRVRKIDAPISSEKLLWTSISAPFGSIRTRPVPSSRKNGTKRDSSRTDFHSWLLPESLSTHCHAGSRSKGRR